MFTNNSPNGIRAVIFDCDGTLYPFDEAYRNACLTAFNQIASVPFFNPAKNHIRVHGVHAEENPKGAGQYIEQTRRSLSSDFIKPNVSLRESLNALGNVPLYILSHSEPSWITKVVEQLQLEDFFPKENRISAISELGYSKRDPDAYEHLLKRIGVASKDASQVIMVDDSQRNLRAAGDIGLRGAWVGDPAYTSKNFIAADTNIASLVRSFSSKTPSNLCHPSHRRLAYPSA